MSVNYSVFWRLLPKGNSGTIVALFLGQQVESSRGEIILAVSNARPVAISRRSRAFRLLCKLHDVVSSDDFEAEEGIGAIVLVERSEGDRAIVRTRFRLLDGVDITCETFVRCGFSWSPFGFGKIALKADEVVPDLVVAAVERPVRQGTYPFKFEWETIGREADGEIEIVRGETDSERDAMNKAVAALRSIAMEETDVAIPVDRKNAAEAVPRLRSAIDALDEASRTTERFRR